MFFNSYFLLLSIILAVQDTSARSQIDPNVVNPEPMPNNDEYDLQEEFPYGVAVLNMKSGTLFCTGTLIGRNKVMTAAHCFFNKTKADFYDNKLFRTECNNLSYVGCVTVSVGYANYQFGDQINVVDIILHEAYFDQSTPFYQHDLAILILETEVELDEAIQVIDIAPKNSVLPNTGVMLGWEFESYNDSKINSSKLPDKFNFGYVKIMTLSECRQELETYYPNSTYELLESNICSRGLTDQGSTSCHGDSGGPLVCKPQNSAVYLLCAVISGSKDCRPDRPALQNSIGHHQDWISETNNSIASFPRKKVSDDEWHFEAYADGDKLSPKDFLYRMKAYPSFTERLVMALKQVPFQDFILEIRGMNKNNWDSTDYDYLFRVEKKIANPVCQAGETFKKMKINGASVIVSCKDETWNFAKFLRNAPSDQVVDIFQEMANDAMEIVNERSSGIEMVTSNQRNSPGIHLAIVPVPPPDYHIMVATGYPYTESKKTEIVNWNKTKLCEDSNEMMFPTELSRAAGGILEDKPTICGGWDGNNHRNDCWQLSKNEWSKAEFSLKTARRSHASLIINNQLIITGGWNGYRRLKSTELIQNGRRSDGPDLQLAIYGHCMVSYHSRIYIIGGMSDNEETAQTWIHSYDMKFIENGPEMTTSRHYHGCTTLNIKNVETILVVGSYWNDQMNTAEFLDATTNRWKEISKRLPTEMDYRPSVLPTPDSKNALIVYKGKVYQALSDDGEFIFEEVMELSIERSNAVAFLLPENDNIFQGC